MGTRSITKVMQGDDVLVAMYRQFDGYEDGHGKDLRDFLINMKVINGIRIGGEEEDIKAGTHANGMGCLAAQMIAHFKTTHGIGGFYINPKNSEQEYNYTISEQDNQIFLSVNAYGEELYNGPIKKYPAGDEQLSELN